jgi:hypothetical protein
MMLARSGVDYSGLTITDDPVVWRDVETGERSTSVVIEGPKDARLAAFHALFDRGLTVGPYPDKDYWCRRGAVAHDGVQAAEEPEVEAEP